MASRSAAVSTTLMVSPWGTVISTGEAFDRLDLRSGELQRGVG